MNIIDESGDNILDWLSQSELVPSVEATIIILRVLTIFSLYEDAVEDGKVPIPAESKYSDFCIVMRDMLCETWRLFYLLYRRLLGITDIKLQAQKPSSESPPENISRCCDLLSLLHEELGDHKWCNCGRGL